MSIASGMRFGPYEVVGPIGTGGMGEVYRATDTNLKRDVALKVLPESVLSDANRLARLQREAEVLASLNHTNVAHVYGLERGAGRTAIVMELIDGVTLAERIAHGPLAPSEALNVAMQIAAGLEAAHEQGIVHRDLKPANIKLKTDGTVKVLDFGIAKALDTQASGSQALTTPAMTEAGLVLGTAAYMAPEQARGRAVDKRADIWAFGCVLYEMLTGKPAFLGEDVTTTLARVLERDPDLEPLPAGLAPAVRRTLELCLQKNVQKRLSDIRDVRLALGGEFAQPVAELRRPPWRRALPIGAALAVGALLAGGYMASRVQPATPTAPAAAPPVTRFVITPPATAPLASLGGYDVVISPDGKRLAYFAESRERGGVELYVRELDGLEAKIVRGTDVASPGAGNMNPFFSPDGKSIGFFHPDRGVVRVAVDGSPPLKMLDRPAVFLGASWTDDNSLIFSAGRSVQRVSATGGGTPEPLTQEVAAGNFVMSPVPLPGGRAVLFGVLKDGVESVAVADLQTGEQKTLIENAQNATYSSTGHIVFARGSTLLAAPFSAKELALTGDPVAMLQDVRHPNPTTAADYALAANGTLVYVPGNSDSVARAAVVWVDRAGNVVQRAVADLVEYPRDPRLSPDGTRLVLTAGLAATGGVWSYDLRGRPPIPLAVGSSDNRMPVWSPDGKEIAFVVAATGEIFVIPGDGSALAPRPLRADHLRGGPEIWSAAGEVFLITSPQAPDIRAVSIATTTEIRNVVASEYNEFDAALAPNGRWLAYASTRSGQPEVWVQGYPDRVPVRVSPNGGYEPRWSADGKELYYLQGPAMMAVSVQTDGEFSFAAPTQLFSGRYFVDRSLMVGSYDVARDGRFLMIEPQNDANAAAGSIVVVENWAEELKRRVPSRR